MFIVQNNNYKMAQSDSYIICSASIAITLADQPSTGTVITIVADGGDVQICGGTNPIQNGDFTIAGGTFTSLSYSNYSGNWSVCSTSVVKSPTVLAPNYYIDPIHGTDANQGNCNTKPLKTYAALQTIMGHGTTLATNGPSVVVSILNPLPLTDPITFDNFLGNNLQNPTEQGINLIIQGQQIVLHQGTLTGAVAQNPAATTPAGGQPNTITDPTVDWTNYLSKVVLITSGPAAGSHGFIAVDLGNGVAQISDWVITSGQSVTPLCPAPSVGAAYQILDYTTVYTDSTLIFGAKTIAENSGSIYLQNLHTLFPTGQGYSTTSFSGYSDNVFTCEAILVDCITESTPQVSGSGTVVQLLNCEILNLAFGAGGGQIVQISGLVFNGIDVPGFGGMDAHSYVQGGHTMFVGGANQFAALLLRAFANVEMLSFWSTIETIDIQQGACVLFHQDGGGFTGQLGNVPLWGNPTLGMPAGSGYGPVLFQESSLNFYLSSLYPSPIVPPNLITAGGSFAQLNDTVGSQYSGHAVAFLPATGNFGPMLPLTLANLFPSTPMTGFQSENFCPAAGQTSTTANASRPDNTCTGICVQWNSF
jgi:hypothetical protein